MKNMKSMVVMVAYVMCLGMIMVPTFMNCLSMPTSTTCLRVYSPDRFSTRSRSMSLSRWYAARAGLEKFSSLWICLGPTCFLDDDSRYQ